MNCIDVQYFFVIELGIGRRDDLNSWNRREYRGMESYRVGSKILTTAQVKYPGLFSAEQD